MKGNKLTHQVHLIDHFIGIHGIGAVLVVHSFLSIANTSNPGTFSTWKYNYLSHVGFIFEYLLVHVAIFNSYFILSSWIDGFT